MSEHQKHERNSFQEALLELRLSKESAADIFSRAAVQAFDGNNWREFGYPFTQIFEPNVLHEIALLENLPFDAIARLEHCQSSAVAWLKYRISEAATLGVAELLNLASALVSISRFELATVLVEQASARATASRDSFEVGWLEFLISNRCDDGARSPQAFAKMRTAAESGAIPRGRVLDACCQGIVWYVKRREIPEDQFKWCVAKGNRIAKVRDGLESGTVSSWFRGLAMIPAAKGNADETRRHMTIAREAALEKKHPSAFEMNAIKTYYESTLKEHVHLTRDLEQAEQAGEALIALDPFWAPSYGELADAYIKFGKIERAATLFERAVLLGPPYVGYHRLQAARCLVQQGDYGSALSHYTVLAELAPDYTPMHKEALEVAHRVKGKSNGTFAETFGQNR